MRIVEVAAVGSRLCNAKKSLGMGRPKAIHARTIRAMAIAKRLNGVTPPRDFFGEVCMRWIRRLRRFVDPRVFLAVLDVPAHLVMGDPSRFFWGARVEGASDADAPLCAFQRSWTPVSV
jgi:hypothetical protein